MNQPLIQALAHVNLHTRRLASELGDSSGSAWLKPRSNLVFLFQMVPLRRWRRTWYARSSLLLIWTIPSNHMLCNASSASIRMLRLHLSENLPPLFGLFDSTCIKHYTAHMNNAAYRRSTLIRWKRPLLRRRSEDTMLWLTCTCLDWYALLQLQLSTWEQQAVSLQSELALSN